MSVGMADARTRRAALLVLAAAAASAARFYLIRNYVEFVDESVETTTGWLVSEGETMYRTIFSHHMPLAAMASHLVAAVSPTDHPSHFRALVWFGHLFVALAIARGPVGRARPLAGAAAAAAFLLLASVFAPLLWSHLVLNDTLWGIAFAVFFVLLPLPLLQGFEPRAADALVAGACAAAALAGSPVAAAPIAFGLALAALSLQASAYRRWAVVAAGFLGAAALVAAWLFAFGDVAGFREEVLRFNADIYTRFLGPNGERPAVVAEALRGWKLHVANAISDAGKGDVDARLLPLVIAAAALLAYAAWRRGRLTGLARAASLAFLAVLMVLSLRLRGAGFHAIPLHLATLAAASVLPWASGLGAPRLAAAAVALCALPGLVLAARHESLTYQAKDRTDAEGAWRNVARYIESHTSRDERIASFPTGTMVYLGSHRRPATDSIYYLPWQALWEKRNPSRPDTCAQLRAHAPRYVAFQDAVIWGAYPWKDYAACIDRFLKSEYETVDEPGLGGLLLRRKADAPSAGPP